MIFEVTPSQTVGPYFAIGVPFEGGHLIVPEGHTRLRSGSPARSMTAGARWFPTT